MVDALIAKTINQLRIRGSCNQKSQIDPAIVQCFTAILQVNRPSCFRGHASASSDFQRIEFRTRRISSDRSRSPEQPTNPVIPELASCVGNIVGMSFNQHGLQSACYKTNMSTFCGNTQRFFENGVINASVPTPCSPTASPDAKANARASKTPPSNPLQHPRPQHPCVFRRAADLSAIVLVDPWQSTSAITLLSKPVKLFAVSPSQIANCRPFCKTVPLCSCSFSSNKVRKASSALFCATR